MSYFLRRLVFLTDNTARVANEIKLVAQWRSQYTSSCVSFNFPLQKLSRENGYKLWVQWLPGSFAWKSVSYDWSYPGYQRFFSRAAGIFFGQHVFGCIKTWQKPETALEKSLAPRVDWSMLFKETIDQSQAKLVNRNDPRNHCAERLYPFPLQFTEWGMELRHTHDVYLLCSGTFFKSPKYYYASREIS